jgi:hypothetical protein
LDGERDLSGYPTYRELALRRGRVTLVSPLDELFKWLPELDFAVLGHGFAKHGRDYVMHVEDCRGSNPGQHEIVFTHCVDAECESRVANEVWAKSWSEEFTDYQRWKDVGEPEGYVWGTNWSLAYPGLRACLNSAKAAEWTRRLGKPMFEATLETDRFFLRLIFHSIRSLKTSDKHEITSALSRPL